MKLTLSPPEGSTARPATPWTNPEHYWPELTRVTEHLDPPVAVLHRGALEHNAADMVRRAAGKPIRVASKSVRVRGVIDAVLELPGYHGVLAYTLAEALWLAESSATRAGTDDVVVGYPTVDRKEIARLGASAELAGRVTLMIDSVTQLDLIDHVCPPGKRESIRVCLELDGSWLAPVLGKLGVWRSPIYTPADARRLAEEIVQRPGFELVGMMAYEAQIAGVGDAPAGQPVMARVTRWMQRQSRPEIATRRGEAVAAVRQVADLEFVNGGGTGSLESTSADASVTEIAAGSGLLGGHLFDNYAGFLPAPAAAFALPIVRKATADSATMLGGGWIASGVPAADRLPSLEWPLGLRYAPREAAGEVQSPVFGTAAAGLVPGDRVWLRHTKSGELSEHVDRFHIVDGNTIIGTLPSYRGEGKVFL